MSDTITAALIAVGGSVALGGAGLLITWGVVRQTVRDLKERVEKLEAAVNQTPLLAQSIEHLGEKFAASIEALAERFGDQHKNVQEQLGDIKREQRQLRDQLGVRARRTAKAPV